MIKKTYHKKLQQLNLMLDITRDFIRLLNQVPAVLNKSKGGLKMICINIYEIGGKDICDITELKAVCESKEEKCECGKFEIKED